MMLHNSLLCCRLVLPATKSTQDLVKIRDHSPKTSSDVFNHRCVILFS